MENTNAQTTTSSPTAPGPDDPRFGLANVVDVVGSMMEETSADQITNATPCPEYSVKELLEHMVLVARRIAVIGNGDHWSTVTEVPTEAGWASDFRAAAHDVMLAWTDPAKLEQSFEVPWGEFPGAVLMYTYAAELATHAWDLAQATGQTLVIDDEVLQGALVAAKFLPAEGRDTPEMPFSPVVDPGPHAPVLDQIAGWMGRDVLS